ncbi:MAG: NAD(+)/NADH kinase [Anaerolineae bacterium]
MENIKRVGLLYRLKSPESRRLAEEISQQLDDWGLFTWVSPVWNEEEINQRLADLDLLIALGGDGTILRAARVATRHKVPILGVNLGRLGFLAEIEPDNWLEGLRCILEGRCWIEERMMLGVELWRGKQLRGEYRALNEAVIGRGSPSRTVQLVTYIDDSYLTTYVADGVIVATATGSTAYALAAGGPILSPEMKDILLIPIAPHLNLDRALILGQRTTVKVLVSAGYQAELSVDGQLALPLEETDCVVVRASPHASRFVRTRDATYFYRTLMDRLRKGY